MAEIIPFKGILYNVSRVSIEDVLAPPYDIITPEYREKLYRKSPYNIVRIDLGKEYQGDSDTENKYTRAKKYLEEWRSKGILISSERPSFYAYEMSYTIDGEEKKLLGFLGLVKLEELGRGNIHPHECTYSKPKKDRLNLLKECRANISPIFSLYKASSKQVSTILSRIAKEKPHIEAPDAAGAIHRLWQIDGEEEIEIIKRELKDKDVIIADGHHRYETALELQKEMADKRPHAKGRKPSDYVLMFLADMLDEGITILPTHILVKKIPKVIKEMLSEHFEIGPVNLDSNIAKKMSERRNVLGFFHNRDERWYLLTFKRGDVTDFHPAVKEIDVVIMHNLILTKILKTNSIGYEMAINKALERVRSGEFDGVFFLNPTTIADVEKAAFSSVRLPPKSTYFYPKLLTGIVINCFSVFDGSD